MWSCMSRLSPSETSSTKDLSISSRNLLSHFRRITPFLKCGSQCRKTAIDSGRHRCHRGAQNLSDLRKRQVLLKPQQQSLAIQRWQNLQPAGQTHCVFASGRGFEWGRTGGGYQQNFFSIVWQGSCFYRFLFFAEVIYCQIAGDREEPRIKPLPPVVLAAPLQHANPGLLRKVLSIVSPPGEV